MNAKELSVIIKTIAKIFKPNTLPILDNICFTQNKATYTNLKVTIEVGCSYKGDPILIGYSFLKDIIQAYPNKEIKFNNGITAGNDKLEYNSDNIEEYPTYEYEDIKTERIESSIFDLAPFTSMDINENPNFHYIFVSNGNMVATEARILGRRKTAYKGTVYVRADILKIFDKTKPIQAGQTGKKVILQQGDVSVYYSIGNHEYMNWETVYPDAEPQAVFTVIPRADLFQSAKGKKNIICEINNEMMMTHFIDKEAGITPKQKLLATKQGDFEQFSVYSNLLETIVKNTRQPRLEFKYFGINKPILLNGDLIMPLEINK